MCVQVPSILSSVCRQCVSSLEGEGWLLVDPSTILAVKPQHEPDLLPPAHAIGQRVSTTPLHSSTVQVTVSTAGLNQQQRFGAIMGVLAVQIETHGLSFDCFAGFRGLRFRLH